jgi:hypothetical protein
MGKESFEDAEVAEILNKNFISIKVDREERPDIDHIYMEVCQALTGSGGWPLTIIMTPDQRPFFAGTYFPKKDRMGMKGLITILNELTNVWENNRDSILEFSNRIMDAVSLKKDNQLQKIDYDIIQEAYYQLKGSFDNIYGGFGNAPKFPTPHNLLFLIRYWYNTKDETALKMVEETLKSMHKGGIYDHIGFGFSRYSTDRKWMTPHFEKMLYDNALLAIVYIEVYQITQNTEYRCVAEEILAYILRDMTSDEGGFFSAEDADSEGEEGKFYTWTVNEVKEVLGEEGGDRFCSYFDITANGNFEGRNIPNLIKYPQDFYDYEFIKISRQKLFDYRKKRVHPHKDDKILWNGLMIAALSICGRILNNKEYVLASEKAIQFIYRKLIREDGRLLARFRDGESSIPAFLDDYAFLIWGLIELYGATFNPDYIKKAVGLNYDMFKYFWDGENGGLFVYGADSEKLIARPKEVYDGATPSGNSVAALNNIKLARLTGISEFEDKASKILESFGGAIKDYPMGYTFSLMALLFENSKTKEIVIVEGENKIDTEKMLSIMNEKFRPFALTIVCSNEYKSLKDTIPFIEDYKSVDGKATAYICENFACRSPITDIDEFREIIND